MSQKAENFRSRFLQESLGQFLSTMGVYKQLFEVLSEEDVDKLVKDKVFFAQSCSPSAIIQLTNVPACDIMRLVTIEMTYMKLFLPEEVTAILLHEIGHAFNPTKQGMEGEFAADNFAKEKGYSKWAISGLKSGLKQKLIGFNNESISQRVDELNKE